MADKEKIMSDVKRKTQKNVKRKVKSKAKRLHPATIVICVFCLLVGIAAGIGGYIFISADDVFAIKGDKSYVIPLGTEFTYTDEGAKVVSFGKDISYKVKVETNMKEIDDGVYTVDTSEAGEYFIKYTVDSVKYGEIMRVRTITVKGE